MIVKILLIIVMICIVIVSRYLGKRLDELAECIIHIETIAIYLEEETKRRKHERSSD